MKFIKPVNWKDTTNQEGLLFFAQSMQESLFSYSLDVYKPKAVNLRLLCIEALQTIGNIKIGLIKKPNIKAIVDELVQCLKSDIVAKELLGSKFDGIVDRISANKENLEQLELATTFLYRYLDYKKYLSQVKLKLIELVPINREKEKIYALTKVFITELINYGYTPGYIYHQTHQYFYNYAEKVTVSCPTSFFDKFKFNKREFTVVYKASELFEEFKNLEPLLNFKIKNRFSTAGLTPEERKFITSKKTNEIFIVFPKVIALEENAARVKSEIPLAKIANLFSFYHHKQVPSISDLALVVQLDNSSAQLIEQPVKSIVKKFDTKPNIAAQKVKHLFDNLDLDKDTLKRLIKAIDLHAVALSTSQIETKLLTLWTALETLIPKDPDGGKDWIVQICDALVPFQTIGHINKLIDQFSNDLLSHDRKNARDILSAVVLPQKESLFFTVAALVMTVENSPSRSKLYSKIENYPLLKYRLYSLNKILSNSKNIHEALEYHRLQVEWQIRRIYRVRNLIVHSGQKPSYTNLLVENLHNYLDDFLNYIIDKATSERRIRTIKDALLSGEIDCENLLKKVSRLNASKIGLVNYKEIL